MPQPKYPAVRVKLSDESVNAFSILGRVQRALREHGVPDVEVRKFTAQAGAGDYIHLLNTVRAWVSVE